MLDWLQQLLARPPAPAGGGGVAVMVAVIAFCGGLLAVLLTKRLEWRREQDRRNERIEDIVKALYYEVRAGSWSARRQTSEREVRYLDTVADPFGPSDRSDFVFDSVKDDISILPGAVIKDVVVYYKWTERTNRLLDHLLVDSYKTLSAERKERYTDVIIEAMRYQASAGDRAVRRLEAYMGETGIVYEPQEIVLRAGGEGGPSAGRAGRGGGSKAALVGALVVAWRAGLRIGR